MLSVNALLVGIKHIDLETRGQLFSCTIPVQSDRSSSRAPNVSRLLHTTNICVQRQDTLIRAFCATKSTSQYWRTKYCWLPVPLDMLPWLSCLTELRFLTELHTFIERILIVLGHRLTGCQSQ